MADAKEKPEATEQPAAAKSKLPANLTPLLTKVAIFGVIALVAIIAAYLVTLKVLKPMLASEAPAVEQAAPEKVEPAKVEEPAEHGDGHGSEGGGASEFFTIESIVVNPAETGGTRYLSCSVSFEVAKDAMGVFKEKEVKIKDILITILSSKTVDELADIKMRNDMRKQILAVVNRFVAPAQASAVYLTDFVLQ